MKVRIDGIIPVSASLGLQESARFYTERLGFAQALIVDDYLTAQHDGTEVHFRLYDGRRIAEHTSCYLRASSMQTLFEEFTTRGLKLVPPAVRP